MKKISLILVSLFFATTMFVACGGSDQTNDADHNDDTEHNEDVENNDEVEDEDDEETATINASALFAQHCVACHGANGEGVATFPSLVDDEWIHGSEKANLVDVITNGKIDKGMTPYKDVLTAEQIDALADYTLNELGK